AGAARLGPSPQPGTSRGNPLSVAKTCAGTRGWTQSVRVRYLELDALERQFVPRRQAARSITVRAPQDGPPGYRASARRAHPTRLDPMNHELCLTTRAGSTECFEGGREESRVHTGQLSDANGDLSHRRGSAGTCVRGYLVEEIPHE